ncbi:hypothetical protein WUBG_04014 [Wuchereria bancrofti]|uniref:Uncharacterized protein n=1 Tax=Wuchereria bancrofti TaxID=6293 RepID=J9FCK7_WUCBA|nr:hypothetical protein WUBG_04014 [Wuchereria bancrofti]
MPPSARMSASNVTHRPATSLTTACDSTLRRRHLIPRGQQASRPHIQTDTTQQGSNPHPTHDECVLASQSPLT